MTEQLVPLHRVASWGLPGRRDIGWGLRPLSLNSPEQLLLVFAGGGGSWRARATRVSRLAHLPGSVVRRGGGVGQFLSLPPPQGGEVPGLPAHLPDQAEPEAAQRRRGRVDE